MLFPAPSPEPSQPAPEFSPSILDRPRIGRINPRLRERVHHLVATYPGETVRVIREWMAEGDAPSRYH